MTFNGVSVSFLRARLKGGAAGNLVDLTVVEIAGIQSRVVNTLMTSLTFTYIYTFFFFMYPPHVTRFLYLDTCVYISISTLKKIRDPFPNSVSIFVKPFHIELFI